MAPYYPNGNANVLVGSVRMQPYDEAGGDLRGKYRFTYGTNFYGPFTQDSGWGDRVLDPSKSLRIYGYAGGHQAWHELITFRRHLSDTEILDMHTALLDAVRRDVITEETSMPIIIDNTPPAAQWYAAIAGIVTTAITVVETLQRASLVFEANDIQDLIDAATAGHAVEGSDHDQGAGPGAEAADHHVRRVPQHADGGRRAKANQRALPQVARATDRLAMRDL